MTETEKDLDRLEQKIDRFETKVTGKIEELRSEVNWARNHMNALDKSIEYLSAADQEAKKNVSTLEERFRNFQDFVKYTYVSLTVFNHLRNAIFILLVILASGIIGYYLSLLAR